MHVLFCVNLVFSTRLLYNDFKGSERSEKMKSPLITMSALSGRPTSDDIYLYMKGLKENGIDALLIYPRSGCQIEYLSEEWFLAIGSFISSAIKLNMEIWLYDDFNWPSGDCKGRVTSNPDFRLMAITVTGEDAGKITCKSRHNATLFGEKFFPNLLSDEAVDYFISLTHEQYFLRFGEYFGTVIKGFFTDEPSIGYCVGENSIPYYHGMKNDYFLQYGRDFDDEMKSGSRQFYKNAMMLVSHQFKTCYLDKLASWCKSHGILLTGHLMCDEQPYGAVCHAGDFLENLSVFSKPGIDDIWTNLADGNEVLLYGTAEYAGRKNGGMAELFALGPSDISYAKRRATIFLCACHKIDTYFLAISHLDISGNMLVCDYFNDFDTLQPDFCGMRLLSSEAKIAAHYAHKDYQADVYIKYPTEISMENITKWTAYPELSRFINELAYRGIQWKFINGDVNEPFVELDREGGLLYGGEKTDAPSLASRLDKKLITDENGSSVKGIFLRRFTDGTFVAINLFAPAGTYFVNGYELYFGEHDVHLESTQGEKNREKIDCTFEVEYKNPSVCRLMYLNGEKSAKITAENSDAVRFLMRNGTEVLLDGEKIEPSEKEINLPRAVRAYYKASEPIILTSGEHTVLAENDFKYMPSVLLVGNFDMGATFNSPTDIHLYRPKTAYKAGNELYGFGKICFSTKTVIPNGTRGISIDGTSLYCEIYINGEKIGAKIAPPYDFYFEKEYQGEITLEVVQKTSIAPVFGNTKYWDENQENVAWRATPSTGAPLVGFDKISFIK